MSSDVISTLLGVLVGGVITSGSTLWLEGRRDKKEARRIATAIAAEVEAALKIIERRRFLPLLETLEKAAREKKVVQLNVRIADDYLPILRENMAKVGCLEGNLPAVVAEFSTLIKSSIMDADSIREDPNWLSTDPDIVVWRYAEMRDFLLSAISVGTALIAETKRLYGPAT